MNRRIPWHNPYRPGDLNYNPVGTKLWRAARSYVKLCRGISIKEKELRYMVKNMIAEGNIIRGMKSKIFEMEFEDMIDMFGAISSGLFTDSFLTFDKNLEEVFKLTGQSGEMIKNTDDILADPKVILGSIHSVKGGEASHVWLDMSTSPECLRGCSTDIEKVYDEVRIAYVGITRAKQTVGLIKGHGNVGRVWGM